MEDKLTKNALNLLSYVPLLLLLNGYWMFSSQQIFGDVVNSVVLLTERMKTTSSLIIFVNLEELSSQASPMLLIALPLLVVFIMKITSYVLLETSGFTIWNKTAVQADEVDKDLPNFFEAVKLSDADWMVFENSNLRENYGYNFIPIAVEERLDAW